MVFLMVPGNETEENCPVDVHLHIPDVDGEHDRLGVRPIVTEEVVSQELHIILQSNFSYIL